VEAFAASDPLAAERIAEARRLDELLAEAVSPGPVDSALIGRIVARINRPTPERTLRPTGRLLGWASAAIASSLIAGFLIGVAVPTSQGEEVIAELMFGDGTTSETAGDRL
jgi:hypothetical protein